MKNIITIVLGSLALQACTLPVENRAVAVGPIIEEAGERLREQACGCCWPDYRGGWRRIRILTGESTIIFKLSGC